MAVRPMRPTYLERTILLEQRETSGERHLPEEYFPCRRHEHVEELAGSLDASRASPVVRHLTFAAQVGSEHHLGLLLKTLVRRLRDILTPWVDSSST
jgi:hypothetical protein